MKNKLFARVLALCMAVSLLSTSALAASIADLQNVIDTRNSLVNEETQEVRIGYNEGTVTLNENVEGNGSVSISPENNITLDLNGNNITSAAKQAITVEDDAILTIIDSSEDKNGTVSGKTNGILVNSGELTVNGGTITGRTNGIRLEAGGHVTVNDDADIKGGQAGIVVWGNGDEPMPVLTVNGGTIAGTNFGISGNGTKGVDGNYSKTEININGGSITGSGGVGIYHPQDGILNVTDGSISGITGIEIRAGELNITGGTVTGRYIYNGEDYAFSTGPIDSGFTTGGVGVAVSQHTTKQDIEVNISGGTLSGYYALFEQDHMDDDHSNVNVNILGGNFINNGCGDDLKKDPWRKYNYSDAAYDTPTAVMSKDSTGFIIGGAYSDEVDSSYLGCVDVNNNYTPAEGDSNVLCYPVTFTDPAYSDLQYQVGYLTGTGDSVTLVVGSEDADSAALAPTAYQLNGVEVAGTFNTNVISDWEITGGDTEAVELSENGTVTALSEGTVTITATLINGETVTFTVTVSAPSDPGTTDPTDPENPENPGDVTIPDIDAPLAGAPDAATTTIEDEEVPLAGIVTLAELLEALRQYEEIEDIELPEDFKWIDHEYAQAIYWGLQEELVVDTEEDPLDPDEIVTVGLMQEVLDNFVEYYKGYEDYEYTVEGEADEIVMDLGERLIVFYADLERYEADAE